MTSTDLALYRFTLNLKHLRLVRGISQVELSKELNISSRKLQRLESGEAVPSLDLLINLSGILDTSIENLIYYNETNPYVVKTISEDLVSLDFIKLNKELLKDTSLGLQEIADHKLFQDSSTPLKVTNYSQTIFNKAFTDLLAKIIIKPQVTYRAGDFWHNRNDFIHLANNLLSYKDTYFSFETNLNDTDRVLSVKGIGKHKLDDNKVLSLVMLKK